MPSPIPSLPESAPFTVEQRAWLSGYMAGLLPGVLASGGVTGAASTSAPPESSAPGGPRLPILFGSQSGNAQGLAESFGEKLSAEGFASPVVNMEDHAEIDLTKESHVLLVSSTWGEGDPPDNAVEFWKKLSAGDHPKLESLEFSVLALGDTNYADFCQMGKLFDARLEELGAKRIAPRVDCDVEFEDPAEEWFAAVRSALKTEAAA
ncbi:MAG: flavodoxin domain-containing protein [Verrucomicrobiota bacterium]